MADNTATSIKATIELDNSMFLAGLDKSMQAVVNFNNTLDKIQQSKDSFNSLSEGLVDFVDNLGFTTDSVNKLKNSLSNFNIDGIETLKDALNDVVINASDSASYFIDLKIGRE